MAAALMAGGMAVAGGPVPATAPVLAGPQFGHYSPAAQFDGIISASQYVTMRDGVQLAVRIDRPSQGGKLVEGRFPVIWHHSLSISQAAADGAGDRVSDYRRVQELVRHGYVVVQVARRGNGQSFGAMRGYHDRNETQDAFEMVEWLSTQPWSDGKVGMYGCSNTGDAAMQSLTVRPPALKAVWAGCFSWHKFDAFRRGGIFAQWGTGPSRTLEQDMAVAPVDGDGDKRLLAVAAQQHRNSTNLFEMWKSLPYRDSWSPQVFSRFWGEGSIASYASQMRLSGVPVYIQGGWFDELRDQGLIARMNLPGARILIGPWKHCDNDDFALLQEMQRFFDRHLKGIDTGIDAQAPIHYFTMNAAKGSEWRASQSWPVAGATPTPFHLSAKGQVGAMAATPVKAPWSLSFAANYDVRCPDAGSGSRVQPCHVVGAGPGFAGRPVLSDTEVTGDPLVDVWVAADGSDANVFAYLEDVAPDGTVRVVTEGRIKASLRATSQAPWALPAGVPWMRAYAQDAQPLTPGEAVHLRFAMMPTSWVFQKGHRMQVTITGADHRERLREPAKAPRITILGGADRAAQVILPVVR
ncbi:CocE/NonD family hydrolase [Novosphingobium sp. FSY-8]|uniref:CocE/NonD family hydrolase n=2 Tax=Novosphingobium ovatum TaxID=1908523 RepID=A0ABW9X9Y5_9SPHN|nr:CocE/NonD family hydrolase [Novosphingobium ovatum]